MDEFIEIKKFLPHYDKELYVVTPWGVEEVYRNKGSFGFIISDCPPGKHPFLPGHFVCKWAYKNKKDRDCVLDLTYPNHWERQMEGNKILSSIKKTRRVRIKDWISLLLKKTHSPILKT